jgi:cytochrome bd-type quinol oxidase subunit 2
MIQKLKTIILSSLAMGLMLVPALPGVAGAQQIDSGLCSGANLSVQSDESCDGSTGDADAIDGIIQLAINMFSLIVGVISVIMIIVGGLKYITSGGEGTNITGAKNTIMYAIIGLVVVALAQIVVRFVLTQTATSTL